MRGYVVATSVLFRGTTLQFGLRSLAGVVAPRYPRREFHCFCPFKLQSLRRSRGCAREDYYSSFFWTSECARAVRATHVTCIHEGFH